MEQVLEIIKQIIGFFGSAAFLVFLQFLIQRKDRKKEKVEEKEDKIDQLEKRIEQGLADREAKGLERYEEHKEAIDELRQAVLTVVDDLKERKEFDDIMAESLMATSHDKLIYLGNLYQKRGAITLAEQNNMRLIYVPYRKLGGNSDGEGYFNFCMKLPVVSNEQAAEMDLKNKREQIRQLNLNL